jgi:hypothetical protein
MTVKTEMIARLIELNLGQCQNDTSFNDQFIYDLLTYGFKGFNNMTFEELAEELASMEPF